MHREMLHQLSSQQQGVTPCTRVRVCRPRVLQNIRSAPETNHWAAETAGHRGSAVLRSLGEKSKAGPEPEVVAMDEAVVTVRAGKGGEGCSSPGESHGREAVEGFPKYLWCPGQHVEHNQDLISSA